MSLKTHILNIVNDLRGSDADQTGPPSPDSSPEPSADTNRAKRAVARSPKFVKNHQPRKFNLEEALRLRDLGWSHKKIAGRLGNCSHDMVRERFLKHDAAQAAAQPTQSVPVPEPAAAPDYAAKVAAARKAVAKKKPEPPPTTPAAPPAIISQPVQNSTPTSIVTNYDDLTKRRPNADMSHVFLVRPDHRQFALGSEQPCISFDRWYVAYSQLEIIKAPAQFYVLVNAADGHVVNRAWLQSIAMDTAMMKRCIVHRITQCGAVEVFKSRYTAQAAAAVNRYGKQYADDTFQQWMKFVEMPQQNHHLLLDELAADAPPPDVVQMHPADRFPPPPRAGLQQPPMIGPRRCAGGWVVDDEPRKEEGAGGLCTG